MTISSVSVYLGTAGDSVQVDDSSSSSKTILAKSSQEFVAARADIPQASLKDLAVIVSESELASLYDPMDLSGWVSALRPDASVSIKVPSQGGSGGGDTQRIHTSFLLAGLTVTSERRDVDGSRTWTATRKAATTITTAPVVLKPIQISLNNLNDNDDDDDGLVDEDDLLKDGGLIGAPPSVQPRTAKGGDDCGGRKACDDCTCGRAEQEANGNAQQHDHDHDHSSGAPKSSCGKCSLGDAFRCASCPYLGLPAFKPGEEHLVLQLKDDL